MLIWANGEQRPGAIRRSASNIVFLEFSQATIRAKGGRTGSSGVGFSFLGRTFLFDLDVPWGSAILHNLPAYFCQTFLLSLLPGF